MQTPSAISEEVDFLNRKVLDLNNLLIESEKAKSRFLSLVANELNNPMTAILGMLPRFTPQENDPQRELFDLLQSEALALSFRIQNLVAAAEVESGDIGFSNALIHPYELVEEALNALRFPIKEKKIKLHSVNTLTSPIVSDPLKLYLIIVNILANAVCYGNRDGNIDIKIEEDGISLFISVTDEGRGPDVEFKPQIFTRFANGPTGGHGLGIGLSIVRALCERMEGSIDYVEQEGTVTFTVQLPLITQLPDSMACGSNDFMFDSFDDDAIEL